MKLMLVVVQHSDASNLQEALNKAGHRHTKLASTGGFLRAGSTTFLLGVKDEGVEEVQEIVKKTCQQRTQVLQTGSNYGDVYGRLAEPIEVAVGGAVIFVLPLEAMTKC